MILDMGSDGAGNLPPRTPSHPPQLPTNKSPSIRKQQASAKGDFHFSVSVALSSTSATAARRHKSPSTVLELGITVL